jgi:hypothetical protein
MAVPGIGSLGLCCSEVVVVVLSLEGILTLVTVVIIGKPSILCKVLGLSSLGSLEVVCHQVDAAMTVAVAVAMTVSRLMLSVPRRQVLFGSASTIDTATCITEKRVACLEAAATVVAVLVCAITVVVAEEPETWFANRNTTDLGRQACVMSTIMTHLCILYISIFIVIAIAIIVVFFLVVLDKVDVFTNVGMMKAMTIVARDVVAAVGVSVRVTEKVTDIEL